MTKKSRYTQGSDGWYKRVPRHSASSLSFSPFNHYLSLRSRFFFPKSSKMSHNSHFSKNPRNNRPPSPASGLLVTPQTTVLLPCAGPAPGEISFVPVKVSESDVHKLTAFGSIPPITMSGEVNKAVFPTINSKEDKLHVPRADQQTFTGPLAHRLSNPNKPRGQTAKGNELMHETEILIPKKRKSGPSLLSHDSVTHNRVTLQPLLLSFRPKYFFPMNKSNPYWKEKYFNCLETTHFLADCDKVRQGVACGNENHTVNQCFKLKSTNTEPSDSMSMDGIFGEEGLPTGRRQVTEAYIHLNDSIQRELQSLQQAVIVDGSSVPEKMRDKLKSMLMDAYNWPHPFNLRKLGEL